MNDEKYSSLTKNIMLFTISSFGSKIISFLLVPLYTAVLSTEDYGTVDLVTATVQMLIPLLSLNIQDAVLRFALDEKHKKDDVFKCSFHINVAAGIVLAVILLFLQNLCILPINKYYVMFLFAQYFCGALNNSLQMHLKATNKVMVLTVGGIINTFVTCGLNILMLVVFKLGVNGFMLANTLGLVVFNIYIWVKGDVTQAVLTGRVHKDLLKKMIAYSSPLIANSLAFWINGVSDRYILTAFCGVAENGVYSVSYKIPTILSTITGIFYNAWAISAIKEFDKRDSDGFMGNTYSAYSMLGVMLCSVIMIFNIPLATILYSKDFFFAWHYVPFLLVGTVFNGLSLFEGCIFGAAKKTGDVSKTTLYGAAVNTILNFVLIYCIGAYGAAIATMIGYVVTFLVRTYKMKNIITLKTKWAKHYLCYTLLVIQAMASIYKDGWIIGIGISIAIFFIYKEYLGLLTNKIVSKIKKHD